MTDRPTTAAGPWNESNPDWWKTQVESREEYAWQWLVNEWAEARQPDSEALRTALDRLVNAIQATDWDHGAEGAEIAGALIQARPSLAALPPSAPPALDVERLAEVLRYSPMHWEVRRADGAFVMTRMFDSAEEAAEAIAAEYARLQASAPPLDPEQT